MVIVFWTVVVLFTAWNCLVICALISSKDPAANKYKDVCAILASEDPTIITKGDRIAVYSMYPALYIIKYLYTPLKKA